MIDPEALVRIHLDGETGEFYALCRVCQRVVAIKAERDDAEMAAAIHIARAHAHPEAVPA